MELKKSLKCTFRGALRLRIPYVVGVKGVELREVQRDRLVGIKICV